MTLELSEKGEEYGSHHFTDEKTGSTRIKQLVNWDSDPTSVPHTILLLQCLPTQAFTFGP